jgi:hypothetical protein
VTRFVFFILLIVTVGLGAHLWLSEQAQRSTDFSGRERNRDEVKVIGVTPPTVAARRAEESRRAVQDLAGAACVEFYGIGPADAVRAHEAFAAMQLGDRGVERRIEEVSRYWVYVPAARDRRTAEASVAQLKRQGVTDLSVRPDNAISLGVFSTEDAARRFLASLQAKGVSSAEQGPFTRELRELVLLVRQPDTEVLARLTLLQREYPNSQLRAVACPAG